MSSNSGAKIKQLRDKKLPQIACRTATFCRPESLNEAVESFLRQDYPGPKQMVILNDVPSIHYESRHPEVVIENTPTRFSTLGDKMNHLVSGIDADIVVNWPDDDIVLPNALSTIVKHMGDREVFAGRGYWYMESGVIKEYVFRHCAGVLAYRREVWDRVGGYDSIDNGEDQNFYAKLKRLKNFQLTDLEPANGEEIEIYRRIASRVKREQLKLQIRLDDLRYDPDTDRSGVELLNPIDHDRTRSLDRYPTTFYELFGEEKVAKGIYSEILRQSHLKNIWNTLLVD